LGLLYIKKATQHLSYVASFARPIKKGMPTHTFHNSLGLFFVFRAPTSGYSYPFRCFLALLILKNLKQGGDT